jgi:hypothetical protein
MEWGLLMQQLNRLLLTATLLIGINATIIILPIILAGIDYLTIP